MSETEDSLPTPEEAAEAAENWSKWANFDLAHFIDPIVHQTGLTRQEALLYLISERLSQIVEQGVDVRITASIEHRDPGEDDEGEAWKKGKN